jgi:hypothetical protein
VFLPESLNGEPLGFDIHQYHDLYPSLRKLALQPIGVEYVTHSDQVEGKHPTEWRHYFSTDHQWPCTDLSQKWSWIAYQSFKKQEWRLADLAARIAHQSRVSSFRLRQISDSYASLLNSRMVAGDFEEEQLFDSEYTWEAYLAIQTYLVDVCILRDYIAEYFAAFARPVEIVISNGITKEECPKQGFKSR